MAKEKHQIEVDEEQGYTQNVRDMNVCGREMGRASGFIKDITVFLRHQQLNIMWWIWNKQQLFSTVQKLKEIKIDSKWPGIQSAPQGPQR